MKFNAISTHTQILQLPRDLSVDLIAHEEQRHRKGIPVTCHNPTEIPDDTFMQPTSQSVSRLSLCFAS